MNYKKILKDKMEQAGLRQVDIAKLAGVKQPAVSRFLMGKNITAKNFLKLLPIIMDTDLSIVQKEGKHA